MKETILSAIEDSVDDNPNDFGDKINAVLAHKVTDALMTKKMEISNSWLNDIEISTESDEEEED